ncbi:MAG: tRNA(adenine34) deaminase [Microbacteriaceae bacterium]|nr:tRNA-specific adenosine deaminase [Microbacteriaceae bacterium]MCU1583062.1 tRNA-specific adenosine deaminase [Microbacteriaceae bacterium]MDQ1527681.1 tRNA(adenine34) deaminase [Microbacteriaceae bacterium]MDQ1549535.1 tRNA(adenine34) deaminase [Microbacteriaceae bacterium]MDQ1554049.1 tRNA(adenine34) deaminase [Microbacteriaceae bacterium]
MQDYETWMLDAVADARLALDTGDVPVAAFVLDAAGNRIGSGRNAREKSNDPTAHAEILAIREAAESLGDWHLEHTTLVVTLEPCIMCAGAILNSRIPRVVFGAWDEKAGAVGSVYDLLRDRRLPHRVEVFAGVQADACATLLREFFEAKRQNVGRRGVTRGSET